MGKTKPSTEQTIRTTNPKGKHHKLLEDDDVRRWHQSLSRSSHATADVRLRRLGHFCEEASLTPKELVSKERGTITDILDDRVTAMDERGYAPMYVHSTLVAVKSWLAHFGIQVTRKIRIRDAEVAVTLRDEKVPEPSELAEMLALGSLKARAIKQLMAKTGIRPGVIGKYQGNDGLRLRDLPDLAVTQKGVEFLRTPPALVVRAELSKNRRPYTTFLTPSAASTLTAYLNNRHEHGEELTQDSPVIRPDKSNRPFLTSAMVGKEVRESIRPKFKWRPYVLRCLFDTQLLLAESKGLLPESFRKYWMGHKGSIDATYTTNKGRLSEGLLQEMRAAFQRASPFLDLEGFRADPAEKQRQQIQAAIPKLAPDALAKVLELVLATGGKT